MKSRHNLCLDADGLKTAPAGQARRTRCRTIECIFKWLIIWRVPGMFLPVPSGRATVVLMTGCEAPRTTYGIGINHHHP